MEKSYYKSPIGNLEIVCNTNELVSLKISDEYKAPDNDSELVKYIKLQLDEYFTGKRKTFDIQINPTGTKFQQCVWKELQKIPYGETKSYSYIAAKSGNKNAQRAVGTACKKNPILIIIPCHRVIAQNGDIGGFAYGNAVKQKLLKIEN